MNCSKTEFRIDTHSLYIANEKSKEPNYTLSKKTLAYTVCAIALAIFAVIALALPIPFIHCFCLSMMAIGGTSMTFAKAWDAYRKHKALVDYEFALSIKTSDPDVSLKYLKKAAFKCCMSAPMLDLAEMPSIRMETRAFLVGHLLPPPEFNCYSLSNDDKKRIDILQTIIKQSGVCNNIAEDSILHLIPKEKLEQLRN